MMGYGNALLEKAKQVKATKRAGGSVFPGMLFTAGVGTAARSNPAAEDDLSVSEGDLEFDDISSSGEDGLDADDDGRQHSGRHLRTRFVVDMAGAAGSGPLHWLNGRQSTPSGGAVATAQAVEDRAESSDDIDDDDVDIDNDDLGELEDSNDDDAGWTVRDPPPRPGRPAANPGARAAPAAVHIQQKPAVEDDEQFSDIDSSFNDSDNLTDFDDVDLGSLDDELSDE